MIFNVNNADVGCLSIIYFSSRFINLSDIVLSPFTTKLFQIIILYIMIRINRILMWLHTSVIIRYYVDLFPRVLSNTNTNNNASNNNVLLFISLPSQYLKMRCFNDRIICEWRFGKVLGRSRSCPIEVLSRHFPAETKKNKVKQVSSLVPKMCSADPKASGSNSQGIRGYISMVANLKFS